MKRLTIDECRDYVVSGYVNVACSFKADKDCKETKNLTLKINYEDVPLIDIIGKSTTPTKISWQNGPGRSKFNSWQNKSVVEVDFKSPGKKVMTRDEKVRELQVAFMKAGIEPEKALELASKAVDNPAVLPKVD